MFSFQQNILKAVEKEYEDFREKNPDLKDTDNQDFNKVFEDFFVYISQ